MIGNLRKKFVAVFMCVVCLFLFGILISLFVFSKNNFMRRNEMVLYQAIERVYLPRAARYFNDGLPVTVVSADASGALVIHANQIHYLEDKDIPGIIAAIEGQGTEAGIVNGSYLRFLRHEMNPLEKRYALVDTYAESAALRSQAFYSWIIGLGAAALFFGVSLLLSRWIVSPVETAWNRQRQFVADASHELKTPLTVVLSNTDMLIASNAVSDDRNIGRLDNIKAESQRMRGLVEDLLTLARSDNAPAAVRRELISFSYVVSRSVLMLEPTIFDTGRTIESWITDGQMVVGDAEKLRQMVEILMDNACKYSAPGTTIDVRLEPTGKRDLLFSVKSDGAPIPQEELSNIFQRFYRADKSRGEEKGYGLGLAIAESIVREHGGRIWAQTDGVSGNTFCVRLIAAAPMRARPPAEENPMVK